MTTKPTVSEGLTRVWGAGAADPADIVDPDTITAGKVNDGWAEEYPPYQYANWLDRFATQMLAHLNEEGISAWDAVTDYPVGGLAKSTVNSIVYKSRITPNINNEPSANSAEWAPFGATGSTFYNDSGTADDYELTNVDTASAPTELVDGMAVRFFSPTTATTGATVDVQGLGVKNIVSQSGASPGTAIGAGRLAELVYDLSGDQFIAQESYAPLATESLAGKIRIATQAEANGTSTDDRALTPAKLFNRLSTETRRGVAEIATDTETVTGTDDERIVSPLKLKTFYDGQLHRAAERTSDIVTVASGNTNVLQSGDNLPVGTYRFYVYMRGAMNSVATSEEVLMSFSGGTDTGDLEAVGKGTLDGNVIYTGDNGGYSGTQVIGDSTTATGAIYFEASGTLKIDAESANSFINVVATTDGVATTFSYGIMTLQLINP